jgi:hypothetical protein
MMYKKTVYIMEWTPQWQGSCILFLFSSLGIGTSPVVASLGSLHFLF